MGTVWVIVSLVAVVLVLFVLTGVVSGARYYKRMFSEANFRAFYEGLMRALKVAKKTPDDATPNLEDESAFVTDAGLVVGVTRSVDEDGLWVLHISLSQPRTTNAVYARFGFFAVTMLKTNSAQLTPFFTKSGVHHLVFQTESETLNVLGFDEAYAAYQTDYMPIPFKPESR